MATVRRLNGTTFEESSPSALRYYEREDGYEVLEAGVEPVVEGVELVADEGDEPKSSRSGKSKDDPAAQVVEES